MTNKVAVALISAALCIAVVPAEAQFVTLSENLPPTSGCSKPWTYDHGVNLDIKVWSNDLAASDLRSVGIEPSQVPLEGFPQVDAGKVAEIIVKDLSRLKDTGVITASGLPKGPKGEILIHFYAQINLEPLHLTSGQLTGYVAALHLDEVCSTFGEGKNIGVSVREIEIPGLLKLSTLEEMVRNVEGLIYDEVMGVVKVRRQALVNLPSSQQAGADYKP